MFHGTEKMSLSRCRCLCLRTWTILHPHIATVHPRVLLYATHSARFHRSLTAEAYARPPRNDRLTTSLDTSGRLSEHNARLLQTYPYAKDTLLYLAALLQQERNENILKLKIDPRRTTVKGADHWETVVSIQWPADSVFYGKSTSKNEAMRIACAHACAALKTLGHLDKNNKPVLYTWENLQAIRKKRYAPVQISAPSSVLADIEKWNRTFYDWSQPLEEYSTSSKVVVPPTDRVPFEGMDEMDYLDIVSGEPKVEPDATDLENISDDLYAKHIRHLNSQDSRINSVLDFRKSLPVYAKREEILETIKNNPVTLISGDTGSGKSTQVPQFLFESMVAANRGSEAQIIVTQPRRISAVSLSERVAFERNEDMGQTVGYQVRLESTIPPQHGCIFFCTTGILLRRLQDNPSLKGVSHVIVDEVHERDVLIDVLLSLLKNVVKTNPNIRVILMSASLNIELLRKYFNNCPLVEVEGYLHPVREYFLPDVCKLLNEPLALTEDSEPRTPVDLILDLIKRIDSTRPEGGILVFLPGWQEIKTLKARINDSIYKEEKHCVLTLHSMIPLKEQHLVFDALPKHRRKIVLATNIAETAITINDISYVIDVGNRRGQTYNPEREITTLDTQWISKANAIQRRGRAGRVRAGECYRLYTKERFDAMQPYPPPEILCTSLEKVILDGKLFCPPTMKAVQFLSQLPQPPEAEGIEKAVEELVELKVLNPDESLTPMGETIAHFSTHPRVSIALVYAAFLRCLGPVLGIASFLSTNKDPFRYALDDKLHVRQVKTSFASGSNSDHIASSNILSAWLETNSNETELAHFCEDFSVNHEALKFIEGIRQVLAAHLYDAYLVDRLEDATNRMADVNEHERNASFIKAAMTAGTGNNVLRVSKGAVKRGRLTEDVVVSIPESDTYVEVGRESVVADRLEESEPWLIYHSKIKSGESRKTYVRDLSEIPALTMALFGGRGLDLSEQDDDDDINVLSFEGYENVHFKADLKTARVVFELRKNIEDLVSLTLQSRNQRSAELDDMWNGLRDVLAKLLTG